ncbi:hypothetical protein ACLKOZ_01325 [Arthrobacter sp. R4]|uniref:hypothetical protein n=1 Tax=Arthrobacter sp. R4 TaxID=644417 RepID=UPI003ED9585F
MKQRLLLIAALLLMSLGGTACGSQASAGSEATATPTPTKTAKTSTPQQLASVVAEHNASVEQINLDEDCSFYEHSAEGNPKAFAANVQALTCSIGKQTHAINAEILVTKLTKLAPYPEELASLVEDTIAKAKRLAAIKVNDSCDSQSTVSDVCRLARLNYRMAAPGLASTLASWKPYGA